MSRTQYPTAPFDHILCVRTLSALLPYLVLDLALPLVLDLISMSSDFSSCSSSIMLSSWLFFWFLLVVPVIVCVNDIVVCCCEGEQQAMVKGRSGRGGRSGDRSDGRCG